MVKLIFIYNAKSGLINKTFDYAHKIFSPISYSCDLCSITHGNFGPKKEWNEFASNLKVTVEIYYSDQVNEKYSIYGFPSVLFEKDSKVTALMVSDDFKGLSVNYLIRLIELKLDQISSQE